MRATGRVGFSLLQQAQQWLRIAASVLRPRNTTDRVLMGVATDDGSTILQVGVGSGASLAITTNGVSQAGQLYVSSSTGLSGLLLAESSASGTASNVAIYMKADKIIFAFVCGANGQIRYASMQLDGFSCTWFAGSTAP